MKRRQLEDPEPLRRKPAQRPSQGSRTDTSTCLQSGHLKPATTIYVQKQSRMPWSTADGFEYLICFHLGIHTEETRRERDTCTPMFITALFIVARTWKQPRCPSADEWIKKLWYIDTMEYYSAIKRNAFEPVLMRWMKLEPII